MIAVVGSGLHGTFLQLMLVRDLRVPPHHIVAIDPWRQPLHLWDRRTFNCGMEFLRSPASHNMSRRFKDLRTNYPADHHYIPPYHRPSRTLFRRHTQDLIDRHLSGMRRIAGIAIAVVPSKTAGSRDTSERYRVVTDVGTFPADVVILAPGQPAPFVPDVLRFPSNAVTHLYSPDLDRNSIKEGENVLVVGTGIGGAQVALRLRDRCRVHLWTDRTATTIHFDSDPCFVGPKCGTDFAVIDDLSKRRTVIQESRRTGSLPRDVATALHHAVAGKEIEYHLEKVIQAKQLPAGTGITVRGNRGTHATFDRVIVATGFEYGPPAQELVKKLSGDTGALRAPDGYPVPDRHLEWCPAVFVSGALAELEVGPPARNIIGAHLSRRRMLPRLSELLSKNRT